MEDKKVDSVDEPTKQEVPAESKEQYVAKKAYEEVSKDMHKFKSKLREAEAAANEYAAKLKAIEDQKLKDQQQWEELYNREREKSEQAEQMREQDKQLYLRSVKLNALKSELGGKVKDEYLSFANLDNIELNDDGSLSSDSVREVANGFRQSHPQLIPADGNPDITNNATSTQFSNQSQGPSIKELSFEERAKLLDKLQNRNN
jgi:hypothetical protein